MTVTDEVISHTVELAGLICQSKEAQSYLRHQNQIAEDIESRKMIGDFQKLKENYETAQRFGRFHPNYHEAKRAAQLYQKELYRHPIIGAYLESERELDKLLYEVSCMIAQSVSQEVKVPNSDWNRLKQGCKCK